MRTSVRTLQWGYWGEDLSGNHYEDTNIEVAADGRSREIGKMYNSSLHGPRDVGPNLLKRTLLWSQGRFFSKWLDQITEVREQGDGRITVTAVGRRGEGTPGRWELEVQPGTAWMVRHARFYALAKPDVVKCEMSNSGTAWSGAHCIPEKARFNYVGPLTDTRWPADELTFDPVVEKFDEKLYADTQQAVANNQTPTLTIHDYRVSPPRIFEPNAMREGK
jgi:hypothetical protein